MKGLKYLLLIGLLLIPVNSYAQTPSALRVNVDANGSLVAIGSAQTLPLTSCLFSNCRLAVDASGNLKVVIVGGTFTSPLLGPNGTCAAPTYSFSGATSSGMLYQSSGPSISSGGTCFWNFGNDGGFRLTAGSYVGWVSGVDLTSSPDLRMKREGAGILRLTNAAENDFSRLQLGGTTSSFPAIKRSGASIEFRLADDSAYAATRSLYHQLEGGSRIGGGTNGNIIISNAALSDFGLLQFGGTTSSFPAIKRNGTAINFRLADDSADAAITSAGITTSGSITFSNANGGGVTGGGAFQVFSSANSTGRFKIYDAAGAEVDTSGFSPLAHIGTTWAPASGTANWANLELRPTFNGTSSGYAAALGIASLTNTLTGGTLYLIDAGTTTTSYGSGFTRKFSVPITATSTRFITSQSTAPTCTAANNCGTGDGTFATGSNDIAGSVTLGTTPASGFVITFNGTFAAAPTCNVWMAKAGMVVGKLPLTIVTSTTTITVVTNGTAPSTGDIYSYHCIGIQ